MKNRIPEPFEQRFLQKARPRGVLRRARVDFGGVWAFPGRVLAVFEWLLAVSWQLLGASWALLGVFWTPLGRSWARLDRIWARLGAPRLDFKGFRVPPNHVLGSSGSSFGLGYRIQCVIAA